MEEITKAEKAALYFHFLEGCNDWHELFKIAEGEERYNSLTDKSKNVTVSRWKVSHRIKKAHEEIKIILDAKRKQIEEQAKQTVLSGETESPQGGKVPQITDDVNFLDLDNFLQEANRQANQIKDDKERRAWLELIGKYMSFKDRNESETTEIKRFYTPLECEKCEVYNKCMSCNLPECIRNSQ